MSKILITLLFLTCFFPAQVNANTLRIGRLVNVNVTKTTSDLKTQGREILKNPILDLTKGSKLCSTGNAYVAGHSAPVTKSQHKLKGAWAFRNLHKVKVGSIVVANDCKYIIRSIDIFFTTKITDNTYNFKKSVANFIFENTYKDGTLTIQTCTKKAGGLIIIKAEKI